MTARILSYGQDPLTYWVLSTRLNDVLGQLHDPSPAGDALVIYRPSFGRHGRAKDPRDARGPRAEFGEFDAIVGTPHATYLIESRWTASIEGQGESLGLREEQLHRHRILRWYLETWRTGRPSSWADFVREHDPLFHTRFPGNKMAPAGSILAQNLEFVLQQLDRSGTRVRDVVLFIGSTGGATHPVSASAGFAFVAIDYEPITSTGYFEASR